jgi:hypothetical protein
MPKFISITSIFVTVLLGAYTTYTYCQMQRQRSALRVLQDSLASKRGDPDALKQANAEYAVAQRLYRDAQGGIVRHFRSLRDARLLKLAADDLKSLPTQSVFTTNINRGFTHATLLLQVPKAGQKLIITKATEHEGERDSEEQHEFSLQPMHLYRIDYSVGRKFGLDGFGTPQGVRIDGKQLASWTNKLKHAQPYGSFTRVNFQMLGPENQIADRWLADDWTNGLSSVQKLDRGIWWTLLDQGDWAGNPVNRSWITFDLQAEGPFAIDPVKALVCPASLDCYFDAQAQQFRVRATRQPLQ